jgi:hypothetical protein
MEGAENNPGGTSHQYEEGTDGQGTLEDGCKNQVASEKNDDYLVDSDEEATLLGSPTNADNDKDDDVSRVISGFGTKLASHHRALLIVGCTLFVVGWNAVKSTQHGHIWILLVSMAIIVSWLEANPCCLRWNVPNMCCSKVLSFAAVIPTSILLYFGRTMLLELSQIRQLSQIGWFLGLAYTIMLLVGWERGSSEKAQRMAMAGAKATAPGSYWLAQKLFLRALGCIYCVAFLSAATQNQALVGEQGIEPFTIFLDKCLAAPKVQQSVLRAFLVKPSLFWVIAQTNANLQAVSYIGIVASLLLVCGGCANKILMTLLWIHYMTIYSIGKNSGACAHAHKKNTITKCLYRIFPSPPQAKPSTPTAGRQCYLRQDFWPYFSPHLRVH